MSQLLGFFEFIGFFLRIDILVVWHDNRNFCVTVPRVHKNFLPALQVHPYEKVIPWLSLSFSSSKNIYFTCTLSMRFQTSKSLPNILNCNWQPVKTASCRRYPTTINSIWKAGNWGAFDFNVTITIQCRDEVSCEFSIEYKKISNWK